MYQGVMSREGFAYAHVNAHHNAGWSVNVTQVAGLLSVVGDAEQCGKYQLGHRDTYIYIALVDFLATTLSVLWFGYAMSR